MRSVYWPAGADPHSAKPCSPYRIDLFANVVWINCTTQIYFSAAPVPFSGAGESALSANLDECSQSSGFAKLAPRSVLEVNCAVSSRRRV